MWIDDERIRYPVSALLGYVRALFGKEKEFDCCSTTILWTKVNVASMQRVLEIHLSLVTWVTTLHKCWLAYLRTCHTRHVKMSWIFWEQYLHFYVILLTTWKVGIVRQVNRQNLFFIAHDCYLKHFFQLTFQDGCKVRNRYVAWKKLIDVSHLSTLQATCNNPLEW